MYSNCNGSSAAQNKFLAMQEKHPEQRKDGGQRQQGDIQPDLGPVERGQKSSGSGEREMARHETLIGKITHTAIAHAHQVEAGLVDAAFHVR